MLSQEAAPGAHSAVAVRAGRVLDVCTGNYREHQIILIEGDRIKEIGPTEMVQTQVPAAAKVVDLSQFTVLPGLIDAHTHITFDPGGTGYRGLSISVPREALIGARNARVTLLAGFTTIRNVGARRYSEIALRDAINAGDVPGPRIDASGPAISFMSHSPRPTCGRSIHVEPHPGRG
jgi:imidazolonepropionase-like amidohydrolase